VWLSLAPSRRELAHELNNPAAAVKSGAEQLQAAISSFGESHTKLSGLELDKPLETVLDDLADLAQKRSSEPIIMDALARSDLEYDLGDWLRNNSAVDSIEVAPALVALGYTSDGLSELAKCFPDDKFDLVLSWLTET